MTRVRRLLMLMAATCALALPAGLAAQRAPVVPGADRLFTEYARLIRGKRVALVANHSARLADGTHLADALHRFPGVTLRVLFGMEYDIRTNDYSLPQDPDSTMDGPTGVPKYDLYYGRTHKPTRAMLGDVQTIVVDMQDVGARFYEHINVLGFVMEAAAENGIDVVVLDRPNPIGGQHADGFVADSAARYGFGSFASIPVVHGMTMGELARYYAGEHLLRGGVRARLTVVPMKGWRRAMWWDDTGLPWRKPSPNLPTLEATLAYAGTCLFEATNLSEGRGSDAPFQEIGAPWLDNLRAATLLNGLRLPGVVFDTVTFTPERKPFHSRAPRFSGQALPGIRLRITDRESFRPVRAGIALLWAVHTLHADRLVLSDDAFARLSGTARLKSMILAGTRPEEIFAAWTDEVAAFRARGVRYFLYE